MIVYNTTFYIPESDVDRCLDYLKKEYIPRIVAGGILRQPSLRRVLLEREDGSESFALQFLAKDGGLLNEWLGKEGRAMQERLAGRFGNGVVSFTTLMETIDWEQ